MRKLFATVILFFAATAAHTATVTLTFSEAGPEYLERWDIPYVEDGFSVIGQDAVSGKIGSAPVVPTGNAVLIGPYGFWITITGTDFSLDAFDIGFNDATGRGYANVYGFRDGEVVISEFFTDIGTFMETLTLGPGFENLDQARISFGHSGNQVGALDNIVLSSRFTVPIPGAIWLFASALAGLGWLRRRTHPA